MGDSVTRPAFMFYRLPAQQSVVTQLADRAAPAKAGHQRNSSFNVHEPPNTIVRPSTRALAEYSS